MTAVPFSQIHLSNGYGDRYAKGSEAVHDCRTDLNFSNLPVEVA
jgi:hypothetical protein